VSCHPDRTPDRSPSIIFFKARRASASLVVARDGHGRSTIYSKNAMHRRETEIFVFVVFMFEEFIFVVQILVYGLAWCFNREEKRVNEQGREEGGVWFGVKKWKWE